MKKQKRIVCLLLAIAFCIGMYPTAFGSSGISETMENGVLTLSGSGSIGNSAYWNDTTIEKVIINEGISSIGTYAFSGCTKLTEISLPASLESVLSYAFQSCTSLTTVNYAGTQAQKAVLQANMKSGNDKLLDAEWICADTVAGTDNSFSFTSVQVTRGSTASVTLSLDGACAGLGAQLAVSAKDSGGNSLAITAVTLGENIGGAVNSSNDGTIVLASSEALSAGTVLAVISFDAARTGTYTLTLSGDAYTGSGNVPIEYSVNAGTITVLEPTVTVTWKNYDGSVLKTDTVDLGSTPAYSGATPGRSADTLYTYSFTGWTPTITAATGNAVYTACFEAVPRTYSVSIDCGVSGAVVSVKDSAGASLTPNADGSFSLVCGQSYSCTVEAVGYSSLETSISIDDTSGTWIYSGDSAVLTLSTPEKAIGDVDNDADVDMTDAQALYNYLAGNYSLADDGIAYDADGGIIFNSNVADINASGAVGADDILPMLELVASGAAE